MRLEYVALVLALVLSVAGVAMAMLGAGRLYAPSLRGRRALLLPAGALVYIAVPPARDFATSGLENGLVLAYLGLLWWMMVCWSQALRAYPVTQQQPPAARGAPPTLRRAPFAAAPPPPTTNVVSRFFDAALAFVAGLSVLVRPELALIGGLALIMMLVAARGWRRRVLIVVAGGLVPVGLRDLPDGLLRPAVPRHRAGQGCVGIQMGARLCVSGQLQSTLSARGPPRSCSSVLASSCWSPVGGRGGSAAPPRPAMAGLRAECKVLPPW